jgi:hypothetical protein
MGYYQSLMRTVYSSHNLELLMLKFFLKSRLKCPKDEKV